MDVEQLGFVAEQYRGASYMVVGFIYQNKTDKVITAFQFSVDVSVTDALGRVFKKGLRKDCTKPPLPARETRSAGNLKESSTPSFENCTAGEWGFNRFIEEDMGMYNALRNGSSPAFSTTVNRVVFADGTALGVAR